MSKAKAEANAQGANAHCRNQNFSDALNVFFKPIPNLTHLAGSLVFEPALPRAPALPSGTWLKRTGTPGLTFLNLIPNLVHLSQPNFPQAFPLDSQLVFQAVESRSEFIGRSLQGRFRIDPAFA